MNRKMCRCCLITDDNNSLRIPITSKSSHEDSKTLEDYLNTLCNYSMQKDIKYPDEICIRCYKALEVSYHFLLMSFESKWKFEELWRLRKTVFGEGEEKEKEEAEDVSKLKSMGNPIKLAPIQLKISQLDEGNFKVTMENTEAVTEEEKFIKIEAEDNLDKEEGKLLSLNQREVNSSSGNYKCRYCPETSERHDLLIHHTLKEHKYLIPFKCKLCTYCSCNHESLVKHYKNIHQLNEVEQRLYQSKELLETSAEDLKTNGITFQCNKCEFRTHILGKMDDHLWFQHDIQDDRDTYMTTYYNCPACYKQFTEETAAKIHFTMTHNMQQNKKLYIYICQKCGKSFELKSSLMAHERICEMREPINCNFCHQKFNSIQKYEQHLQCEHSVDVKYECEICEKSFKSSSYLSAHRKRHNERHWQCELCPKNYINHSELRVHMQRIHKIFKGQSMTNIDENRKKILTVTRRTLQCEYCGFTSSSKFAMEVHLYKHTGRPYKCKFCPKQFVLKKTIKQHCLRFHSFNITDSELAIMFKEKHGYPSRFDTFSERNNNLQIEEIDFKDLEVELQAFNLSLDDIMQDVFESKKEEEKIEM